MTLLLALTIGSLYGAGVWLLLQRSLSRIVMGLAVIGHGANLLLLAAGGPAGDPPVAGADPATTADPLPQALALTAIVITFGVSAFLLAMAYRSWLHREDDEVEDDLEDRRIAEARRSIEEAQARTAERTRQAQARAAEQDDERTAERDDERADERDDERADERDDERADERDEEPS